MKPARCSVCGILAREEPGPQKGEWLTFADHEPTDTSTLSHPQGLEYFCAAHRKNALELKHLTAEKAIAQLQAQTHTEKDAKPSNSAAYPATGLRRLIDWLRA